MNADQHSKDLLGDERFPIKLDNIQLTEVETEKGKVQVVIQVESLKDDPNYVKCPRCWNYHAVKENFDGLCDRCWPVLLKDYPDHWSVKGIKESIKAQRVKYGIKEEDCKLKL